MWAIDEREPFAISWVKMRIFVIPHWFWEILVILGRLGPAPIVILRPSSLGNSALSFSIIKPGMNSTMSK